MDDLVDLVMAHKWMGVAVLVTGFLVRLLKSDTKFPIDIPSRYLPLVTVLMGQVYAVLSSILAGKDWKTAVTEGIIVSFTSMGLFDILIKTIRNGNDLPLLPKDKEDATKDA